MYVRINKQHQTIPLLICINLCICICIFIYCRYIRVCMCSFGFFSRMRLHCLRFLAAMQLAGFTPDSSIGGSSILAVSGLGCRF